MHCEGIRQHSKSQSDIAMSQTTPISYSYIACSRLSDRGEDAKVKGTRKVGGAGKSGKRKGQFPPVFFMFTLSQFSRPDYLGAWNTLTAIGVVKRLTNLNIRALEKSILKVCFINCTRWSWKKNTERIFTKKAEYYRIGIMRTLVRLTDVTTTCVDVIIRVKVNKVSLPSGAVSRNLLSF